MIYYKYVQTCHGAYYWRTQAMATLGIPESQAQLALELSFNSLVKEWSEETSFLSSLHKKAMHPAYQRIIQMGKPVLPLIFADLSRRQVLWFWALNAITGEDPVPENAAGNDAVQAW